MLVSETKPKDRKKIKVLGKDDQPSSGCGLPSWEAI